MDTITILNNILLPVFLFIVYFSLGSLFVQTRSAENQPLQEQPNNFMKQYADAFADEPPFEPDEIMTQHQEELHIENTPVDTTMTNRSAHKEEIALGTPKTSLLEFLIPSCRQKCNFQFR